MRKIIRMSRRSHLNLTDLNLTVASPIAKPPNLIDRQYFRLYGIFHSLYSGWVRTNRTVVLWSSGKNTLISEVPGLELEVGTAEREGWRGGCCWLGDEGT